MSFEIGQNVGPYRITSKLGQGGMATVYRAYQPSLDRSVAIKVLHPAFKADPSFVERFQREARIIARLEHPHIVPIFNADEFEGQPYLVMKFIEGETLKARLGKTALNMPETLTILDAVASALTYAHHAGVLHRDIKPSNILIEVGTQHPYLADFGLARMADAGESTMSQDVMLGTPHYISPEQAQGIRDLTAGTDIYSLGVILYEIVVGRVPFVADTPYAIVHDHIFASLPLPTKVNPNVPPAVEAVLLRTLAKDPRDRFDSAVELAAAFRKAVTDAGVDSLPGNSYRIPLPASAPANSGTTAVDTPRPEVTPILSSSGSAGPANVVGSVGPVDVIDPGIQAGSGAPGLTADQLSNQMKTLSEQRRRQNRRRQQANLWVFVGVAGLILTCLAAVIVVTGAFADPLVRVNALAPQAEPPVNGGEPTAAQRVPTGLPSEKTTIATLETATATGTEAVAVAGAAEATIDATDTSDASVLQSLLNGQGSAADRAIAAHVLYLRASQVQSVAEAAAFRRLANEVPRSGDAAALAALAALRAGEKSEATRLIGRAEALSPESIYVQFISAVILDESGDSTAVQVLKTLQGRSDAPDWLQRELVRLLRGR